VDKGIRLGCLDDTQVMPMIFMIPTLHWYIHKSRVFFVAMGILIYMCPKIMSFSIIV
jgi:hypothetical protein